MICFATVGRRHRELRPAASHRRRVPRADQHGAALGCAFRRRTRPARAWPRRGPSARRRLGVRSARNFLGQVLRRRRETRRGSTPPGSLGALDDVVSCRLRRTVRAKCRSTRIVSARCGKSPKRKKPVTTSQPTRGETMNTRMNDQIAQDQHELEAHDLLEHAIDRAAKDQAARTPARRSRSPAPRTNWLSVIT